MAHFFLYRIFLQEILSVLMLFISDKIRWLQNLFLQLSLELQTSVATYISDNCNWMPSKQLQTQYLQNEICFPSVFLLSINIIIIHTVVQIRNLTSFLLSSFTVPFPWLVMLSSLFLLYLFLPHPSKTYHSSVSTTLLYISIFISLKPHDLTKS